MGKRTIRALQLAKQRRDTPEEIAHRLKYRAAYEQATAEAAERYPVLTAENVAAAIEWKERRIDELLKS